jgi:glycosyl transferase family 25
VSEDAKNEGGLSRIIVVSLPSATERREKFEARAKGVTTPWQFFDAHRGLSDDLTYDPLLATRYSGRTLQPGELGCYSSHYAIWGKLLEDDVQQYIVLEDDVCVDWERMKRLAAHDFSADRLNYVRLYFKRPCKSINVNRHYLWRGTSLLQLLGKAYGTQAYIITKSAAAIFRRRFSSVVRPIDDQMDRYWEHHVPNHALFPFPLFEEAVPSAIGADRFQNGGRERRSIGRRARQIYERLRWSTSGLIARL